MLKLLLPVTVAILMALLACTGATPAPAPTEATSPTSIAAATSLPANTPEAEGADPTATTAATEAPSNPPTRKPQTPKLLTPLNVEDAQAVASQLSEAELECIGGDPGRLGYLLFGEGTSSVIGGVKLDHVGG